MTPALPLADKVALVTGAGRGLGRSHALSLAAAGARVVVNDLGVTLDERDPDARPAQEVVQEIRAAGGEAVADTGDVTKEEDVRRMLQTAIDTFGGLDILVNNAGNLPPSRFIDDMKLDDFDETLRVHLRGHVCTTIAAVRHWRAKSVQTGQPVDARIVNTASEAYLIGNPWRIDYAAAKAGIVELTMGTSYRASQYGVMVNAICPRALTRMTINEGMDVTDEEGRNPYAVEFVSPLVVALCGPAGANITGQVFVVFDRQIQVLARPEVACEFRTKTEWTQEEAAQELVEYFSTERPSYALPMPGVDD